eukprot:6167022-Amphidinium_carterae.1
MGVTFVQNESGWDSVPIPISSKEGSMLSFLGMDAVGWQVALSAVFCDAQGEARKHGALALR